VTDENALETTNLSLPRDEQRRERCRRRRVSSRRRVLFHTAALGDVALAKAAPRNVQQLVSATCILPQCQHLAVGHEIPLGRGPSWPVATLEANHALVLDMRNLGGFDWVWQFGLYAVDERRTRLVSRSCVRTGTAWARLATYAIEPAGFFMMRRMLLGLRERAEALRAATVREARTDRRPAA
jgi:hypothetical protein